MKLEVISKTPENKIYDTPILLVHGAWHGAWCWDDGFMDYLASHGWEVHAFSLRGHGNSEGREKLRWHSMADYAEDVAQVVDSLPKTPILVGHSMGGGVVQKYLQTHEVPGAVLLGSVPKNGTLQFVMRVVMSMPIRFLRFNLTMSAWPLVETPELTRKWFYSDDVPNDQIQRHFERIQDESFRAALDMIFIRPKPHGVKTPIFVLAGESDAIFSVPEEQATAQAYNTEAIVFPGMAHNLMSEPGWEKVADKVMEWASQRA